MEQLMKTLSDSQLRRRSSIKLDPVSMTEQVHKPLTDIENIVETYRKTGHLPHLANKTPQYVDNTLQPSFEEMHDAIQNAKSQYDRLPTQIKNATNNDYRLFETWLRDPRNLDEAAKYGLLNKTQSEPSEPKTPPAEPAPQKAGAQAE